VADGRRSAEVEIATARHVLRKWSQGRDVTLELLGCRDDAVIFHFALDVGRRRHLQQVDNLELVCPLGNVLGHLELKACRSDGDSCIGIPRAIANLKRNPKALFVASDGQA
jgi:hypothetical protein